MHYWLVRQTPRDDPMHKEPQLQAAFNLSGSCRNTTTRTLAHTSTTSYGLMCVNWWTFSWLLHGLDLFPSKSTMTGTILRQRFCWTLMTNFQCQVWQLVIRNKYYLFFIWFVGLQENASLPSNLLLTANKIQSLDSAMLQATPGLEWTQLCWVIIIQ